MRSRPRRSFGFGSKLFVVILLAMIAGFVWALVDRKPWESSVQSQPDKSESRGSKKNKDLGSTKRKDPSHRDPDGSRDDRKPDKHTKPNGSTGSAHTESDLRDTIAIVERDLAKAKFEEAWEALAGIQDIRIENADRRKFIRNLRKRILTYRRLLRETRRGATISMPAMSLMQLRNGNKLITRSLRSDATHYSFEDIRGIRSRLPKSDVRSVLALPAHEAFWEVWYELKRKARTSGVNASEKKGENGYEYRFKNLPNRRTTGLQFFELADFCVSNGMNELITILLDEALKRDADLVRSVHEMKGERMVNLLFYFLTLPSPEDAEFTLRKILLPHYSDTRSFRERLQGDAQARDLIAQVLRKNIEISAPPDRKPNPDKTKTPPLRKKDPVREAPVTKPPNREPTKTKLPSSTPAKVRSLVTKGDRAFRKAMKHLLNSDPNSNADGWGLENKKALRLFQEAAGAYGEAQSSYKNSSDIPRGLLDRFREAQLRMSLCRKRAVSGG